ncbi:MAG: hypothetical protein LBS58_04965 [Coriobacteriales bacterium]|jgi:glycine cleavage system aminomethyltransferase T|nr:hypothetical protein [Coriobacteriales bacterium]
MQPCSFCNYGTLGKLRISGADAGRFIATMTTANSERLALVGAAAPALLLTGEGEVIDVVMAIRTGDAEYMLTTSPSVAGEAFDWLLAHSKLCDGNGPVFPCLSITDETMSLAVAVLIGAGGRAVLDELVQGTLAASTMESLSLVQLDTVPVMVLTYPFLKEEVFELYCAPGRWDAIEHVLLSFPEIDPIPLQHYLDARRAHGTWFAAAEDGAYRYPDEAGLAHLIRPDASYVGAAALQERTHRDAPLPCSLPDSSTIP